MTTLQQGKVLEISRGEDNESCYEPSTTLQELLKDFTKSKPQLDNLNFDEVNKFLAEQARGYQTKVQTSALKIAAQILPANEEENRKNALYILANRFILSEFGLKYGEIDQGLFNLGRMIEYKKMIGSDYNRNLREINGPFQIMMPLFAHADFIYNSSEKKWDFKSSIKTDSYNYDFTISSNIPPTTEEIRAKVNQAEANYLKVISKALETPTIRDIVHRNLEERLKELQFRTYWIPKPSDLDIDVKVIDRDPLLVANLYDKTFLVGTWDVEGEEPYEHYLKEFCV